MAVFSGTAGDDVFNEASDSSADLFNLRKGGNDTVLAGSGDDRFNLGAALNAADRLDGGAGNDVVILHGDYSAGLVFQDQTIQHIEQLALKKGFDYNLTTADGNVAAGQFLKINGFALGAGDNLTFNGAAESDGRLLIYGGAGNDTITGGAMGDRFNLTTGGNDTVHGGGGNDVFLFGAAFTSGDVVDGGTGRDTLELNGAYGSYTFGASQLTGIETLRLDTGHNYLTTNDGNVGAGNTLTVDASALTAGNNFSFNGGAEHDGNLHIIAGSVVILIVGGSGDDTFDLTRVVGAATHLDGKAGNDLFLFGSNFTDPVAGLSGDTGDDTLELNGDYASVVFGTGVDGINTFRFDGGHSYGNVTIAESNLDGSSATVDASQVSTLFHLTFQNSPFTVEVGSGGMTATPGGPSGNDTFIVTSQAALAASTLDAGNGGDTLELNGDFSAGFTFGATTATNFEALDLLGAANSYDLTLGSGFAGDDIVTVDASAAANLILDVSGEPLVHFVITGSAGDDQIIGADNSDTITGGGGADTLTGGASGDIFTYASAADSTSTTYDTITDFAAGTDQFDVVTTVTSIDGVVGLLDSSVFDAALQGQLAGHMAAGRAVVFDAVAGGLAGHTFVIVDGDGDTTYDPGSDYVIDITGVTGLIATGDFV